MDGAIGTGFIRISRAKERNGRHIQRGGQMHGTTIIRYQCPRYFDNFEHDWQIGLAHQVNHVLPRLKHGDNLLTNGTFMFCAQKTKANLTALISLNQSDNFSKKKLGQDLLGQREAGVIANNFGTPVRP